MWREIIFIFFLAQQSLQEKREHGTIQICKIKFFK